MSDPLSVSENGAVDEALPRHLLRCNTNPNAALNYLISIDDCAPKTDWSIALRYVPDKLIVEPGSLIRYAERLAAQNDWEAEGFALAILDDLNNETVPRWVEIACANRQTPKHRVLVVDRQPNWEDSGLLARLPPW